MKNPGMGGAGPGGTRPPNPTPPHHGRGGKEAGRPRGTQPPFPPTNREGKPYHILLSREWRPSRHLLCRQRTRHAAWRKCTGSPLKCLVSGSAAIHFDGQSPRMSGQWRCCNPHRWPVLKAARTLVGTVMLAVLQSTSMASCLRRKDTCRHNHVVEQVSVRGLRGPRRGKQRRCWRRPRLASRRPRAGPR